MTILYALWDMCASESVLVTPLEGVNRCTRSINQNWGRKSFLHRIIYKSNFNSKLRMHLFPHPLQAPLIGWPWSASRHQYLVQHQSLTMLIVLKH